MQPRTIVLTGASDGIGAAAVRTLTAHGHRVLAVGRTASKMQKVADETGVEFFLADFAKLDDVRRLADELLARDEPIDVLANNAGGVFQERKITADGHEMTFQVNYLAPFLLTSLLLPALRESGGSVINTASEAQRLGRLDVDNLDGAGDYRPLRTYANSKLAQVLFAKELSRREHGRVASACLHPGVIASNFGAETTGWLRVNWLPIVRQRLLGSPDAGADTLIWLCEGTAGVDWTPGGYYAKRKPAKLNPQVGDIELAGRLWRRSEEMLGLG